MELIENGIVEQLHRKADQNHTPLSGVFEVSPVCNMDCRMCYVKKSLQEVNAQGGLKPVTWWIQLAEEAKKEGLLFVLLTGGEPFLYPGFRDLYTKLHEMGFVLSINSNATMIDEVTVSWLKKMPPSRINITLYGGCDAAYERLCRNPSGFTQVSKAIDLLCAAGITVKLSASITPYNQNEIKDMILFAQKRKLIIETTAYMFPPIRKDDTQIGKNVRLSPEETAEMFTKMTILQSGKDYLRGECEFRRKQEQDIQKLLSENAVNESMGVQCRAGSSSFWITWDGNMLPCGMMIEPSVTLAGKCFADVWNDMVDQVEKIRLPLACSNCSKYEICHTCAAMIYAETGAFDKKPDYRCKMADYYYEACEKCLEMEDLLS